jgi:uncharacterized membrane protein
MKKLAGALFNYFIKGLLIVVPMGLALFLIYWCVSKLDSALNLSDVLWAFIHSGPGHFECYRHHHDRWRVSY